MKIRLVNVPVADSIREAVKEISEKLGKEIIFEDSTLSCCVVNCPRLDAV